MHEPPHVQIGPTVKRHNRFLFKRLDTYRDEQAIEPTHYYLVLENEDGSEENLGAIPIPESSLHEFLGYLYHWLRQQYIYIYQAKQQLSQIAEDDEARTSMQLHIESLERRYNHVVHAVREIVPDYLLDESNPDRPLETALNEKIRQKLQSKPRVNIRTETGATIKQYGRFHLKEHKLYRDEREIPTNGYEVTLDNGDGSYEELGLIESRKSGLPELLDHLHHWLHARYNDIYQIKQLQKRTKNDEIRAGYQSGLDDWELRYARVDRAIREIEPDYQPDESIYERPPTVRQMHASWAEWYTDLKSLKHASDISVAGSIVGIAQQMVLDRIPYTDFTFHVSQVLYDPHHLVTGQPLLIHQTGGMLNNQSVSVDDDPLFQVGEQAVLFLRQYSPGHYLVVGGPSGRFRITNHQVTPVTNEGVHLNWPVPDSTFFTQVQQA